MAGAPAIPPPVLTEAQQAAWFEALALLEKAGRADRVNLAHLEVYARAVVRMREAEAKIAAHGVIVAAPRTGLPIRNPHLGVAAEASAQVAKLSALLGLEGGATREPEAAPAGPMSLNAYAKHRGVTARAVRKAVETERLRESVVYVGGKAKIGDVPLADREWDGATRPRADRPGAGGAGDAASPDGLDYSEARRRREIELWRQAQVKSESDELELQRRRGELIAVADAREDVFEAYSVVRTKLLGVPARARQRLPHLTIADVAALEELIRDALEELSGGPG